MIGVLKFFLLVATTLALPQQQDVCNEGVSYWCQNRETAVKCGVLEYCKVTQPGFLSNDVADSDAQPILIELYYESLCGGCRQFILEQLFPTYEKLYSTGIFDIKLYPYGNAKESKDGDKWKFECQHGKGECQMNLIETCALHLMSHPHQFMPFINCVEKNATMKNAQKCAESLQVEWGPISQCYSGSEGNFLEHQLAQKTEALKPQHQYVPWIVVDGKHTEQMQTDAQTSLEEFICTNYKGTAPKECKDVLKQADERRCFK